VVVSIFLALVDTMKPEGIFYQHKVYFSELNCSKRTLNSFKNKDQGEYHEGDSMSIFLDLPNIVINININADCFIGTFHMNS